MSSSNCAICCLPLNDEEDNSVDIKNKLVLSCEGHPQSRGNLHVKHSYHFHCAVESLKNGYYYCPIVPRERVCYDFNSIKLMIDDETEKKKLTKSRKTRSLHLYHDRMRMAQLLFYFFLVFFFFLTNKDQKQSLYSISVFSDFISLTSFLFLIGLNWNSVKKLPFLRFDFFI